MDKRWLHTEPTFPFCIFGKVGAPLTGFWRTRGAGFRCLWVAPPPHHHHHLGPGTGQRIPGRRARRPLVTPGPRSAGVNDRCRRRVAGAARDAGGLGRPLNSHHIALSPSNTPTGHAIGRAAPPPTRPRLRIGCRPGTARPAARPFSLCATGCAGDPWPGARLASARPSEPRCCRSSIPNHSVHIRGKGGEGHKEAWASGGPAVAAIGSGKARRRSQSPAFHGLQGGPQEVGPVPRARGPDRLRPGLPRTPSSCGTALAGRGWHQPRGRLRAALPQLSLDCGEE